MKEKIKFYENSDIWDETMSKLQAEETKHEKREIKGTDRNPKSHLNGSIRSRTVGNAVREAAGGSRTRTGCSVTASAAAAGLFVGLDDVV